jgi:FkbM family methyltransferase
MPVKKLRHLMTPASHLMYLAWRFTSVTSDLTVFLKGGEKLRLRRPPSTDLNIAYEVFAKEVYRGPQPPDRSSVRRIVDLGANVGLSVLYWATHYPGARIEAYEPHPVNLARLEAHLTMNRIASRVTVHSAAVGISPATAWLSDEGGSSRLGDRGGNGFSVPVVDFFESVGSGTIDLLKIDIEGGEYAIFMDQRFSRLDVRSIAFEWHNFPPHPDAEQQIFSRLNQLGWTTARGVPGPWDQGDVGIGYAFKPSGSAITSIP